MSEETAKKNGNFGNLKKSYSKIEKEKMELIEMKKKLEELAKSDKTVYDKESVNSKLKNPFQTPQFELLNGSRKQSLTRKDGSLSKQGSSVPKDAFLEKRKPGDSAIATNLKRKYDAFTNENPIMNQNKEYEKDLKKMKLNNASESLESLLAQSFKKIPKIQIEKIKSKEKEKQDKENQLKLKALTMKDLVFKMENPIVESKENYLNNGNISIKTNSNKPTMNFVVNKPLNYTKSYLISSKCAQQSKNVSARIVQIKNVYCGICQVLLDNKSQIKTFICTHKFHSVDNYLFFNINQF